jgi:hypothetical protein
MMFIRILKQTENFHALDRVTTVIYPVRYLCLINKAPRHGDVLGESRGIAPPFLTLEVDGGGDQIHVPAALSRGKSPRYPLDMRLCGPQSRYGGCRKEKNPLPLPGN